MRDSFTPEEVDRIENKAYEVGVGIGVTQERERIIALLEESRVYLVDGVLQPTAFTNISAAIALIKGENG